LTGVSQTTFGDDGNCFAACVATLLHLPIKDVPNFCSLPGDWMAQANDWAAARGFQFVTVGVGRDWLELAEAKRVFGILAGNSHRGRMHAVVWYHGETWDPHPDRTGLVDTTEVTLLVPLEPPPPATAGVERPWGEGAP